MTKTDLLTGLTDAQKEAVTHTDGPILVVAGAGTGKTTVITRRIAWLSETGLAKPEEILALTFTEKAAAEMTTRVDELTSWVYSGLSISTFHSFGADIISDYAFELGLPADLRVLTDVEQILFIRDHIFEFELHYYRNLSEPTSVIRELTKTFSRLKDENIDPVEYVRLSEGKVRKSKTPEEKEEAEKELEVAKAFEKYEDLLRKEGYIDYGDQINLVLKLLEMPSVAKRIRDRYKYCLVDEFQDTNWAQNELIRKIFGESGNVMVVGDDDQCLPGNTKIKTPFGAKRISDLKSGDEVLTAIGNGYIGVTKVNKVFCQKKLTKQRTFFLEGDEKFTATSNHKLFCYIPKEPNRYFTYIYLMESKAFGYRIGITNNPVQRLKLERMADRIIAIRACETMEEAIYFENYLSLKYQIPTICYRDRNNIKEKTIWLERLHNDFDTKKSAAELAYDFGINLSEHHYALDAVNRSGRQRTIVNILMNYRKYVPKNKQKALRNYSNGHILYLETSNSGVVEILRNNGYELNKAKKGFRLRMSSVDLLKLEEEAQKIKSLTGAIIEYGFKVANYHAISRIANCISASNVLPGMYLPVLVDNRVKYMRVLKVNDIITRKPTYDLAVDNTYNYIANNIVVHNSIYRFRGASVANILGFRDTYKNVKTVVLNDNFRSTQDILDASYRLIQNNNPERLEAKYQISKKLKSHLGAGEESKLLTFETETEEAEAVAEAIQGHHAEGIEYGEMAVLFRANNQADEFMRAFRKHGIPFVFSGAAGLYEKQEVKMLIALTCALANPEDDLSVYHLALSDVYNLNATDLGKIAHLGKRRNKPLEAILKNLTGYQEELELSPKTVELGGKIAGDLETLREEAKNSTAGEIVNLFLRTSGYYGKLTREAKDGSAEAHARIANIAAFFDKIIHFQRNYKDHSLKKFSDYLNLVLEAGDDPKPFDVTEGLAAVSLLSIHKAKGLEFSVVFISSLSDTHIPGRERADKFLVPAELLKEKTMSENSNLNEERRLFYVAATRAKKHLYLTAALDYGTKKTHKISRFVLEMLGETAAPKNFLKTEPIERIKHFEKVENLYNFQLEPIPDSEQIMLSRAQIDDYLTCPFKFQLIHITPIRIIADANIAYGNAVHNTIGEYYKRKMAGKKVLKNELHKWFNTFWDESGFLSKEHERARYETGRKALNAFYEKAEKETLPEAIEKEFKFLVGNTVIRGRYDAVFTVGEKRKLVDFKTSKIQSQKEADDRTKKSTQLATYALSFLELTGELPSEVELYFVENGLIGKYHPTIRDAEKTKAEIEEAAKGIRKRDFKATPGLYVCKYCPFCRYCPESITEKVQS